MLFTHFGVSGPLVLSASCHIPQMEPDRYTLGIDLKPGLTPEQLDLRLQRDFQLFQNRTLFNALSKLLPKGMIPAAIQLSGMDGNIRVNQITKAQRLAFGAFLKAFPLTVQGFRPISEAIITRGGVSVKEVSPKTMESKLLPGLFLPASCWTWMPTQEDLIYRLPLPPVMQPDAACKAGKERI